MVQDQASRLPDDSRRGILKGVAGVGAAAAIGSYVDFNVDGQTYAGDERRNRGIHANAALRVDPCLGNT